MKVNRLLTTNPGLVEAGLVIRLGLRLDAPLAAEPATLVLEMDGHPIAVDLRT